MALRELSRYEILRTQCQADGLKLSHKESLDRICQFLYEHTDLYYLAFIREEHLIQYIKHHNALQFKEVSFTQVIKDLKFFIHFLKNKKDINKKIDLDLSLYNIHLWLSL